MKPAIFTNFRRWARLSLLSAVALSALTARAEPAMWVVRDKDSTIYLIGTVHLLRHETEWDSTKVKKALTESSELWLEVANVDDVASVTPLVAQYGLDLERPLSSKLTSTQTEQLARVASAYGVPLESLEQVRPWMVAVMFTLLPLQQAGYNQNAGIDRVLKRQAEKEGDKVFGFETAEEQVRFFAELPETEQIAFLNETLSDAEKGMAQLETLAKAWVDGDNETIGNILVKEFKSDSPLLYDKLVVQRNIAWSKKVVEILKGSGIQQIAVGAAHLAGPDSLQMQLIRRGIKVERY